MNYIMLFYLTLKGIFLFIFMTLEYNVTEDGWIEYSGHQYYISDGAMQMEDARKFCKKGHGDLVVINSEAERLFLWKQVIYFLL